MMTIEDLRQRVREIPPLPDIAVRLLQMSRDPEVAPRDLVDVIRYDAAITAKVLRLCNSAFYGLSRRITSLHEAMVYLGVDALVNFVLAGCLAAYCQDANHGYGLDPGQLWTHSVGCAICSQKTAERYRPALAATAFTCGLLHDLGKIILNTFVAEDFRAILDLVEKEGAAFSEAEQRILGYTHAESGAQVAETWRLPPEIVSAIRHHHAPMEAEDDRELVALVHVGDVLCMSFGVGVGVDGLAYQFDRGVVEMLGIKTQELEYVSIEFHDAFKRAREALLL